MTPEFKKAAETLGFSPEELHNHIRADVAARSLVWVLKQGQELLSGTKARSSVSIRAGK